MSKIIIAGDAFVVKSAMTLENIKELAKHSPKSLCLFDEDGEEVFGVAHSKVGSISQYGACFASCSHDEEKCATITISIPSDVKDAKEYITENYGSAIANLNKVEAGIGAALDEVAAAKAVIRESIVTA